MRLRPCSRDVAGRLDLTFEDMGEQALKNIARPVRVYRVRLGTNQSATKRLPTESGPLLSLPDKPSIAVLPFQNMSGDPDQEYFADGMVEEIITSLSRIRWLFVIARNSSFAYKGRSVDVKQVGRELGVRYVLEGSVRKAGQRLRITGQLIDAVAGTHLWADRFDGSLEDVFDLQDKVAISVAGVIEPTLQAAETARSVSRPTTDLTAYDLYLRAFSIAISSDKQMPEAIRLLERSLPVDTGIRFLACRRPRSEAPSTHRSPTRGPTTCGELEERPPTREKGRKSGFGAASIRRREVLLPADLALTPEAGTKPILDPARQKSIKRPFEGSGIRSTTSSGHTTKRSNTLRISSSSSNPSPLD